MTLEPFILRPPETPPEPPAIRHSARAHAKLSASGAERWMNCAGSVAACRDIPAVDTVHSLEGNGTHELAEHSLVDGCNAETFLGKTFSGLRVTLNMAAAVQVYVDEVRRAFDIADRTMLEQRVSLAPLNPPAAMFGTIDAAAYSRKRRELRVIDFKYGKGVWVGARNNPQLLYYALGAVLAIGEPVSQVTMTIVQPRFAGSDPIRSATVDAVTLAEWSFELLDRAHAALAPDAPRVAGAWCRFCPAKEVCPEHQTARTTAAVRAFAEPPSGMPMPS